MIRSMPNDQSVNYATVLQIIYAWPSTQRFTLVQDVLKTLAPPDASPEPTRSGRRTLDTARGLLATNRPAPSDAEIDQWLVEHRLEKYG